VSHKRNAIDHPAAQIPELVTVDDVMNSPLLSWPVKRLDISPTSDGAVALVMCNERVARTHSKAPVFIEGVGYRLDTAYWCTRDLAFPDYVAMAAKDAYEMAGISNPADQIDVWEPYDPFDYKALHHLNGLMLDKSGKLVRKLFESGAFERDGSHPVCPSGGALGVGNPIAATGLMKIAELYFQLSGQAGKRQVQKPVYRGVAQAWGDLMQVGTVVVMASEGGTPRRTMWSEMTRDDLPGTALKTIKDLPTINYTPDLQYKWDVGYAMTTYLDGLKNGKIRGSYCSKCNRMMIPARSFCELCDLETVYDYYDLPDSGTVRTFTLSHVDWDSSKLPEGQVNIFAVIAIDGCEPDMGLVHKLGEVDPADVKIGMRVRAVWKPAKSREGGILDIKYFKPYSVTAAAPLPERIKPVEVNAETAGVTPGKIPLSYVYTAGIGGTRFYDDLKKGKISGTWCDHCQGVHIPPAAFCEFGMMGLDVDGDAQKVDPKSGMIYGYSVVHEDRMGHPLAKPEVVVQVYFPGTVGTLFGKLIIDDPEDVEVGMTVELVASPKNVGAEFICFKPRK